MQRPPPMPDCPLGLEYLTQIDKILIQQKVDLLEGNCGVVWFGYSNKL